MSNVSLMGWDAASKVWRKVLVNTGGKLIIDPSEIFENDPTDNEHGKAPDSDWAHDHAANVGAHHVKYTDAEAMMAFYNNKLILSTGTYIDQNVSGKGMLVLITYEGDIELHGLAGGTEGQRIFCVKPYSQNDLRVYHNSGSAGAGNIFITSHGNTDIIPAGVSGAFWLCYYAQCWVVDRLLNI